MTAKENRHYRSLELDKILEKLSEFTASDEAGERAIEIMPCHTLEGAQTLIDQTVDAHMLLAKFGGPSFGGLVNVNNSLSRAEAGGTLTMGELLKIAGVLSTIRGLIRWREHGEGLKTSIDGYFNALIPNRYLEDKITSAIISEEEMSDNASTELANIRRKIRAASSSVREKLDRMIRSPQYQKYLQDPIVTMRNGRFVVPVRNEHRSEVPGLVHDTSSSGATVFVEPIAVVEANNAIKVLQSKERDEIDRIIYELSVEAGGFAEAIKSGYENAVELDLIFAKAQLAYKMKASKPLLNDKGIIALKRARHPLIDPAKVVATDIFLGKDFDTLVITGPNTGGKTVSIKTIGLFTLMAMCGLMIPAADESEVSVFDNVLADIGDEQSIEQSLSTFSAHMTNIIDIMKKADDRSLVLIDELGAGTDPVEGAALAMAILERLNEKGAKIGATTHYAELKAYALQTPRVENGSCEFDVATLRPTYRLLIGVPGRSNAFAISLRIGMEEKVIERAKELVSTENSRFENVVASLEESRRGIEREREDVRTLKAQADREKQAAEAKKEEIETLREKELEKARGEALRIVERAKREAASLMLEIEKLKKESKNTADANDLARRAKQQMKRGLGKLQETTGSSLHIEEDESYVPERPLKAGDSVIIAGMGTAATVIEPPDKNGNVLIQAGLMKTRVKQETLRLTNKKESSKPKIPLTRTVRGTESRATAKVNTSCDLRGKTVDEALMELDMFIDSAVMSGINEFTVIHGKGTGALRSAVQTHLRSHPQIRTFRLGVYGEGENGVTIVTLK